MPNPGCCGMMQGGPPRHQAPFGSDWVGGAVSSTLSVPGLGPVPSLPPPPPVVPPVAPSTPRTGLTVPVWPSRDVELEPAHFRSLLNFVRSSSSRLRSVANRFERHAMRNALLDWRDAAQHERLDHHLQQASNELRAAADRAREERKPHEVEALEQRLAAVKKARAESQGAYRLARVLQDMRWRRIVASMAHWKDTALIRAEERWMLRALHDNEEFASCPSKRWQLLGATEEELHAILRDQTGELGTQARSRKERSEKYRIFARRLRGVLVSQQQRLCWDALSDLRSAPRLPRVQRIPPAGLGGTVQEFSPPQRSPVQGRDFAELETESWGGDSATLGVSSRNGADSRWRGGSPPWMWAHVENDFDEDDWSETASWASLEAQIADTRKRRARAAAPAAGTTVAPPMVTPVVPPLNSSSTLPFVSTSSSVQASPSAWHGGGPPAPRDSHPKESHMHYPVPPRLSTTSVPAPVAPPPPVQTTTVIHPARSAPAPTTVVVEQPAAPAPCSRQPSISSTSSLPPTSSCVGPAPLDPRLSSGRYPLGTGSSSSSVVSTTQRAAAVPAPPLQVSRGSRGFTIPSQQDPHSLNTSTDEASSDDSRL